MQVKQVYAIVNETTKEILGEEAIVNEDLSNVVDIGTKIFDANATDNYVRSLVDHIGKVVFVNRPYSGRAPKVLMDAWEFGSILEKVSMAKLPEATENESWELQDGSVYEQDMFYKPQVEAQFFNSLTSFEVPISITEKQVKEAFSNATQLNAFISMIYNAIDTTMTLKVDALVMRTINNFIAETIHASFPDGTYTGTSNKAVNLLKLYNDGPNAGGTPLTKAQALTDMAFLKFASLTMSLYVGRMSLISTLFNIAGKERFTPRENLHIIMLDNFAKGADVYLQADTFHNEMTKFPEYETISYWQGTGTDYALTSVSKIDVKSSAGHNVEIDGILAVMFDRNALGVTNMNDRVKTHVNGKAEFTNYWFKRDAGYFNAQDENFVVFFIG